MYYTLYKAGVIKDEETDAQIKVVCPRSSGNRQQSQDLVVPGYRTYAFSHYVTVLQ